MRRLLFIIWICFWTLNSIAQEFGVHWLSHPISNDSSEVLFRHVYLSRKRPSQAALAFTSCGKLKVYVNERNITTDNYLCGATPSDSSHIRMYTYDITRFLRPDSNVVAVWYAPEAGMPVSKQLSLEYFGTTADGKPFHHQANGEWLCKELQGCRTHSNRYTKDGNMGCEQYDGRAYDGEWKSTKQEDSSAWQTPLGSYAQERTLVTYSTSTFPVKLFSPKNILLPTEVTSDETGIHYDFGRYFQGCVRITLREAKRGEVIHFQGLTYTCNGELDEQAFLHFTTHYLRSITVKGDKNFKESQITHVEALEY